MRVWRMAPVSEAQTLFAMLRLGIDSKATSERERNRALRLVLLMHGKHGHAPEGTHCRTCTHWIKTGFRDKTYRKCELYRTGGYDSSDWRGKWPACGAHHDSGTPGL